MRPENDGKREEAGTLAYRARSIQPKFRPVQPGKVVHLKRWNSFFETSPVGPNRSIEFWTEISGNFDRMDRAHNAFKMAPDFGAKLDRGRILIDVCKMGDMVKQISLSVQPFLKVNQSGQR